MNLMLQGVVAHDEAERHLMAGDDAAVQFHAELRRRLYETMVECDGDSKGVGSVGRYVCVEDGCRKLGDMEMAATGIHDGRRGNAVDETQDVKTMRDGAPICFHLFS